MAQEHSDRELLDGFVAAATRARARLQALKDVPPLPDDADPADLMFEGDDEQFAADGVIEDLLRDLGLEDLVSLWRSI